MLALHLLRSALVHINTLLMQQVSFLRLRVVVAEGRLRLLRALVGLVLELVRLGAQKRPLCRGLFLKGRRGHGPEVIAQCTGSRAHPPSGCCRGVSRQVLDVKELRACAVLQQHGAGSRSQEKPGPALYAEMPLKSSALGVALLKSATAFFVARLLVFAST
ncbi:hypothetical protein ACIQVA_38595 [Streptomyces microflavus]|uniref:hypothetical protein n=1 Tax=Streptomyces microflavus TaxID=1919 RepID=UPI0037FCAC5D